MAKLIAVPAGKQAETISKINTKYKATSLAGGLALPEGEHTLVLASKDAFGCLLVNETSDKPWNLPIVAGKVGKEVFELSDKPGAKTLVIQDQFYIQMKAGGTYTITVSKNKQGRSVVSNVVLAEAGEDNDDI